MARIEATYPIAPRGLATSFTESELPVQYSLSFRNRFINAAGGAEKRQGIQQLGNIVPSSPDLNAIHELVKSDGTAILLVSGMGSIYKFDDPDWTQVKSGLDATNALESVQMGNKLIFVNGVDRNFFTEDGETFSDLKALVNVGAMTSATTTEFTDADVTDWLINTNANENDIVFNVTQGAYGAITAVTTGAVTHTAIGSAATGLGQSADDQADGDRYEIIDAVELNIIPTDGDDDNVATAGPGTDATTIAVSGVNFSNTDIKAGDWIRNTTRSAVVQVSAVATAVTVTSVASQTANDSLVFLKSAMPITSTIHVHFGRAYYGDTRDKTLVRISGPDDPQDLTTDAGTLDSTTFKFGELQPQGEIVKSMASFQRFFAIAGEQNMFLFQGTDPIIDTSGGSTDFGIIGLFPQGTVSKNSLVSIGNDLAFITPDGVQSTALVGDASTLGRANISEALKTTIRKELAAVPEAQVQIWHYPRRSWLLIRIASKIYVFNYTPYFGQDIAAIRGVGINATQEGSWSLFDGGFARQNFYFVRADASMVCCGNGGKVFNADVEGVYDDDGEIYTTEYKTGWLTITEPRKDVRIKEVKYIKPIIEAGSNIQYTIRVEGMFDVESSETITVNASGGASPIGLATIPFTIGGSSIQNIKYALRARGEQFRYTFTTRDDKGPDTISRYTLYANMFGRR